MSDLDTIKLVQGDYGHSFQITVTDAAGVAIDISGTTVRLFFKKLNADALTATVSGTLVGTGTDGKVKFVWPQGALDEAGRYVGEVEVDTGVSKQTVYPILKFNVRAQLEV